MVSPVPSLEWGVRQNLIYPHRESEHIFVRVIQTNDML